MNKKYILIAAVAAVTAYGANEILNTKSEDPVDIFYELDDNHDNNVTINELRNHYAKFHDSIDDDHNNTISLEEAQEDEHEVPLDTVDANHDNKISFEEGFAIEVKRFEEADINSDGKVSKSEFYSQVNHVTRKEAK